MSPRERDRRPAGPPRDGPRRPQLASDRTERGGERTPKPTADTAQIWGYHPVREALRSPRRKVLRVVATTAAAEKLAPELAARTLVPTIVSPEELARRLPRDSVHQGVMLEARPLAEHGLDDLSGTGLVLVLDQLTDPHNVGAILRTAAAFGAEALVTTARHAPALTGVLAKAASGALEHVPIVAVVNLARALEHLGDLGYQRVGLDSEGSTSLTELPIASAVALVLGSEGKGLRRLTRENCDAVARLDMPGAIKSLNVSNACAAALTVLHLRGLQKTD